MNRFTSIRKKLEAKAPSSGFSLYVYEFILFGFKQGWACLFGGLMLFLLLLTHFFYPYQISTYLTRYDFLTISAIVIQILMLKFRLESWDEAKVIFAFHVVGTVMEIFKTSIGSWIYPDSSVLNIAGVPLFTGFMYASVGSYLARVWRIFDFKFDHFPKKATLIVLGIAIYANFFLNHWFKDIRSFLFIAIIITFWRTKVWFKTYQVYRYMPLLIGFFLVALFIWFAENIGTFSKTWIYPQQQKSWSVVSFHKIGSWYLLMIISFIMVSFIQKPTENVIQ
jgi:uncharacterized membrane protein YoaT (DUF817 family)